RGNILRQAAAKHCANERATECTVRGPLRSTYHTPAPWFSCREAVQVPAEEFEAIVVGSGISGGWAAKELTEKGLRVLLLERGKDVEHVKDYVNARKGPWEYPHRGLPTRAMKEA